MQIEPLDDRVLVLPQQQEEVRSPGGIVVPQTAQEAPQRGKIVAVGNDASLRELLHEGDEVLYAKFAGQEVKIEGETYLILNRGDVLAIIRA
ncbi:MAG: co-chaperone GroES [Firmicutes bacterium]|nr:co-chaperone GroES [Bacillota bacterium]